MAETPAEDKTVKDAVLFTLEAEHAELNSVDATGDPELEATNVDKLAQELQEVIEAIRALPAHDSLFDLLTRTWQGWDLDSDPAADEDDTWLESNPYGPMVLQAWREWGQEGEEVSGFVSWLRGFLRQHKPGQLWEDYRSYLEQQVDDAKQ
ncbi:hypothetical protein [Nitrococcus mobilis]|uniref:Uncharacterized protein n=1 Tax=Nitrococcus mobilis Nb-231 TaxID=314278 RepID=A4BTT2_9GAMM|nr:hypothetical protein [Nitrococcus mobilis]EAR20896.1 hypothetical protein NB231_03937 [Nitrococcus mobilis Nb-231]